MHKKYCKNKNGAVYEYYICGTYRKKSNKLCTKHTLKVEELENAVKEAVKLHIKMLVDVENILEVINKLNTKKILNENIENIGKTKENEIKKISDLKRCLYEDWKNNDITREEYLEYKEKYDKDIERIKNIIINLKEQKENKEEIVTKNNLWIENFKLHKNITELDRDVIAELIDYIEVYEDKKITIHFKFMTEFDKI